MPQLSKRARRVADLVHQQLALLLKREINDPRLENISFTAVDVSSDLSQAKVFFSTWNADEINEAQAALEKAAGYLRSLLAKSTALRFIPNLRFCYDQSIEQGARLSKLIDEAIAQDKKISSTRQKNEKQD